MRTDMKTELEPRGPIAETLSDPRELVTGKTLPTRPHTFLCADGTKRTILLQGLPYSQKSELDANRRMELAEAEKKGEAKTDLHAPLIIALAARMPDGTPAFPKHEDAMLFAIRFAGEAGDGAIHGGYNTVLELSGWGEDAETVAGKS